MQFLHTILLEQAYMLIFDQSEKSLKLKTIYIHPI